MDAIIVIGIGTASVAGCSLVGTKVMLKYPGTRAWLQGKAIEAYNYLDKHKGEVPADYLPLWQKAYKAADDAVNAFQDDELTWGEVKTLGYDLIAGVNEVRKIVKA